MSVAQLCYEKNGLHPARTRELTGITNVCKKKVAACRFACKNVQKNDEQSRYLQIACQNVDSGQYEGVVKTYWATKRMFVVVLARQPVQTSSA